MPTRYYYVGHNGDPFTDTEIHTDTECPALPDEPRPRPLSTESVAAIEPIWCDECASDAPLRESTAGDEGETGAIEETGETAGAEETNLVDHDTDERGTCETIKSDGKVCGRDRPCPYHD